jgi:hypothetical protein
LAGGSVFLFSQGFCSFSFLVYKGNSFEFSVLVLLSVNFIAIFFCLCKRFLAGFRYALLALGFA